MQEVKELSIPEGEVRTIVDKNNRLLWGRIAYGTEYVGNISQSGIPTPSSPADVHVVTGMQVLAINDGVDSHSYNIDLGPSELCKIGSYEDYIYKSGDDWYMHKAIDKAIFNGSEGWFAQGTYAFGINYANVKTTPSATVARMACNYYEPISPSQLQTSDYGVSSSSNASRIFVRNKDITALANFKTWLSTHNLILYFVVATAADTKITDSSLVSQLDAIHQFLTRYGYNATVSGNLPIIIDRTAL